MYARAQPRVNQAIKDQLDKYSHVMVWEYSQSPAVEYCKLLASPTAPLDKTYLLTQERSHWRSA
jgi:adenosylmethionine-8-amino-7-oxononanoate aminotransferase